MRVHEKRVVIPSPMQRAMREGECQAGASPFRELTSGISRGDRYKAASGSANFAGTRYVYHRS